MRAHPTGPHRTRFDGIKKSSRAADNRGVSADPAGALRVGGMGIRSGSQNSLGRYFVRYVTFLFFCVCFPRNQPKKRERGMESRLSRFGLVWLRSKAAFDDAGRKQPGCLIGLAGHSAN